MKKENNHKMDAPKGKDNPVKTFFESIGEQHGFGRYNIAYNWLYHCELKDSEVRVVHYILNFTLNGRRCMSRKEVMAFNLGLAQKTVERAISSLRKKKVITGTKKPNPPRNGKYTGSHIEGGYIIDGKQLMMLFKENFKPENRPLGSENHKDETLQLLAEMYAGADDELPASVESHDIEESEEIELPNVTDVPSVEADKVQVKSSQFRYRNMTPREDEIFNSFRKVQAENNDTGELHEFLSPLRAYHGMQKLVDHDDYSPTTVAFELLGGKPGVHGRFVFKFAEHESEEVDIENDSEQNI